MIYASIDKDGRAVAFRPAAIFGSRVDESGQANSAIPQDAVEIDETTWLDWLSDTHLKRYDHATGKVLRDEVPAPTLEELRSKAKQLAAARRYDAETGGMTWRNLPVATDRDSQSKISAAYQAARDGWRPDDGSWKFADGVIRPLTNTDLVEIAKSALVFVQSCFNEEATVINEISSATNTAAVQTIIARLQEPAI